MRLICERDSLIDSPPQSTQDWLDITHQLAVREFQNPNFDIALYLFAKDGNIKEYKPQYRIVDRNWNLILPYFRRYLVTQKRYAPIIGYAIVWQNRAIFGSKGAQNVLSISFHLQDCEDGNVRDEFIALEKEQFEYLHRIRYGHGFNQLFYNLYQPIRPQWVLGKDINFFKSIK